MYKYDENKGYFVLSTKNDVLNSLVDYRIGDIEIIYNDLLDKNKIDENTKDIIEKCIEIGKDEPEYFKNVVRGYTQQIAREIKEYLSKVTQDIGSEEAAREFYDLDLKDLVDEILEETKKRSKPLPEVGETPATLSFADIEEIESEVEKLTESEVEVYIQFIKDGIITKSYSENLPQSKQILMKLMLSRVLNWDTLMDNIYNSYFTQLFNN
jgi:hypothetical protein